MSQNDDDDFDGDYIKQRSPDGDVWGRVGKDGNLDRNLQTLARP